MSVETFESYRDIAAIKAANKALGLPFFDRRTTRFFQSHALPTVYHGRFFVTSEQCPWNNAPRLYTLRECRNGRILTVGEFQGYSTAREAGRAATAALNSDHLADVSTKVSR